MQGGGNTKQHRSTWLCVKQLIKPIFVHFVHRLVRRIRYSSYFRSICIFDVSQRKCSQNQCILFLSPCSRSLHCNLAKYGFSSDASIWLEPNSEHDRTRQAPPTAWRSSVKNERLLVVLVSTCLGGCVCFQLRTGLRQKLQIIAAVSSSLSILTPGSQF